MVKRNMLTRDEILDMSTGSLIANISRSYLLFLNHEIEKYGIHGGEFHFLVGLSNKDSISQEELANTYHVNQSTMARALRKLDDNKLISRRADETNRRKNVITITDKGRETVRKIQTIDDGWDDNIKSLTAQEKKILNQLLKTVALEMLETEKTDD